MGSICLLDVQVADDGEEWMVLAIDKYDYDTRIAAAKPLFTLSLIMKRF